MNRDGAKKSIWQEEIKRFPDGAGPDRKFEVIIVGGGITGVSTALQLQSEGKKCLLLEASNIGFGTTGGTTAHLNDFFDTPYYEVIKKFGLAKAKLLHKAAKEAIHIIDTNVQQYNIDCDFQYKYAYLFALDENQEKELEDMVKGSAKVGHSMNFIYDIPFPIPFKKAVFIKDQAQFHPIKYINGLCEAFIQKGGTIREGCRCEKHTIKDNEVIIHTTQGTFTADFLVYATHIPPGVNSLHLMNAPYRSYAIAFTLKNEEYPNVLGYDLNEPYRYYRLYEQEDQQFLIAGGEDHKSGHGKDTEQYFARLEKYVRTHFDVDEIVNSWSSQYFEPIDGLPYIGKMQGGKEKVFASTGFRGNGMIYGSITSKVLSDLIIRGDSEYRKLFNPQRIKPVSGFDNFIKEETDVVFNFVKDKLFIKKLNSLSDIKDGEGRVVKYKNESFAIYKEPNQKLHVLKSSCTHTHCEVHWNGAEKTWDCPCHGSRYNINGDVLNAPAVKNLERLDLDTDELLSNSKS
ncbi:FAD-dependent oxidoreductase [Chryseobacterium sp. CT-SW4]|uniref:FAD-dependent oxidoreductase n=1 Tax=Chryseobacterium sp. SW-1 TaxID=3157343 RepID=UPI003B020B43